MARTFRKDALLLISNHIDVRVYLKINLINLLRFKCRPRQCLHYSVGARPFGGLLGNAGILRVGNIVFLAKGDLLHGHIWIRPREWFDRYYTLRNNVTGLRSHIKERVTGGLEILLAHQIAEFGSRVFSSNLEGDVSFVDIESQKEICSAPRSERPTYFINAPWL